jgi:type I restriction-modification system DNA methylase subunit
MKKSKKELSKELIDSIVSIQYPNVGEKKEIAYFEYNNGNSEIAKRCISAIREKYKDELDQQTAISIKNIQQMLSEHDIPNRIAKELAILILKEKIVH